MGVCLERKRLSYKRKIKPGDPRILGVTYTNAGINFAVSISDGKKASLLLYTKDKDEIVEVLLPVEDRIGDISSVLLEEVEFYAYNYEVDGEIYIDPYAKELLGRENFGVQNDVYDEHRVKGRLFQDEFIWDNQKKSDIPYEKSIFYKVHVRGYTKNENSKVKHKGTFEGLKEKVPYFKKLGITTLELMPAYEFEELPIRKVQTLNYRYKIDQPIKINYWGYTIGNYFAPKSSYCASGEPTRELKTFIATLHKQGMECVMEFYFPKEVSPNMVLDVLRFWKLEYHVDGFHLLGEGVPFDIIVREPLLKKSKLLFGNVDGNYVYDGHPPQYRNLGEYNLGFQDNARKFLKGDEDQLSLFAYHIRRNPNTHGVINYITNNDGFTLADLVTYDEKHNEVNGEDNKDGTAYNYSWNCGVEGASRKLNIRKLRMQQQKNAILFLMLSQGTPLLYGGDEFGNSSQGNNNVYCQDNEIGWIDWSMFNRSKELYGFIKKAIEFRKKHPILHMPKELRIMDYKSIGYPDLSYHSKRAWYGAFENTSRVLGVMYTGFYAKSEEQEADDFLYIAYNMHWEEHVFALPHLPEGLRWHKAGDTKDKQGFLEEEVVLDNQRMVLVAPRTIMIIISKNCKQEIVE